MFVEQQGLAVREVQMDLTLLSLSIKVFEFEFEFSPTINTLQGSWSSTVPHRKTTLSQPSLTKGETNVHFAATNLILQLQKLVTITLQRQNQLFPLMKLPPFLSLSLSICEFAARFSATKTREVCSLFI